MRKMRNINCTSYDKGTCLHQAAPRQIFGAAQCILDCIEKDPRIISGCALQTKHIIQYKKLPKKLPITTEYSG